MTLRVVIADRSAFVRVAVRSALEAEGIAVVAEADEAVGALRAILANRPDAVLVDAELDDVMAVLAAVRKELPETALIVLSPDKSEIRAMAAVRAGACGFLPKDTSPDRLPDIVRGAAAGEAAIPRRLVRRLLERIAASHAWQTGRTRAADRQGVRGSRAAVPGHDRPPDRHGARRVGGHRSQACRHRRQEAARSSPEGRRHGVP